MSIYFYLNDKSRGAIKSDVTLLARECKIIYDLDEVRESATFVCTELCLGDSRFVSKLRLFKTLYDLEVVVLCYDLSKAELVADYARVYLCDYQIVDMDMIRSAIYNDEVENVGSGSRELPTKCNTQLERELLQELKQEIEVSGILREQVAKWKEQCYALQEKSARETSILNKMMEYYRKLVAKSVELEGSLQQYKAILTKDVYDKVNAFKYKERPQVVYFKEYQSTLGVYELLNVLYNALYHQKHKSVKVVQVMDSNCSMRLKEVPDYYQVFLGEYDKGSLYQNDFICCVGGYQEVLGALLENTARVDVLIVLDTMPHDDVVLQDAMLQYGLCRTTRVASAFALGPNTIVNEETDEYVRYEPLDVENETFLHNASSEVILKLLGDIEEFSSTI